MALTSAIRGQLEGMAGVGFHHLIIAGTRWREITHGGGQVEGIKPILRKTKIKTSERFIKVSKPHPVKIASSVEAAKVKLELVGPEAEGYLLVNNKNQVIGWWSPPQGVQYRQAATELMGVLEKHGAAGAIIFSNRNDPAAKESRRDFAETVSRGFGDFSIHDVILNNSYSMRDRGEYRPSRFDNMSPEEALKTRADRMLYQIEVEHGTGEGFVGNFTADFIGSRNGLAFGWGHYFTTVTAIARHYAEMAAKNWRANSDVRVKLHGEAITIQQLSRMFYKSTFGEEFVTRRDQVGLDRGRFSTSFEFALEWIVKGEPVSAGEEIIKGINQIEAVRAKILSSPDQNDFTDARVENLEKALVGLRRVLKLIGDQAFEADRPPRRQVIKATLFEGREPGSYPMLDWYLQISPDVANRIQGGLRKLFAERIDRSDPDAAERDDFTDEPDVVAALQAVSDMIDQADAGERATGQDIYNALTEALGGKKEASMWLLEQGIEGVRFEADGWGGKRDRRLNPMIADLAKKLTVEGFQEHDGFAIAEEVAARNPKYIATAEEMVGKDDPALVRLLKAVDEAPLNYVVFADDAVTIKERVLYQAYKTLPEPARRAVDDQLAARGAEGTRIRATLERLDGTPWEFQATEALLVRQALEDMLAGKWDTPAVQHTAKKFSGMKELVGRIKARGAEGVWEYLQGKTFIGHPSKPRAAVMSSFANCEPSQACATHCYAVRGNYRMPAPLVKAELIDLAVKLDPIRAAKMTAGQWQADAAFLAGKALRLNDKGELAPHWLPYVAELNRQGIRLQIFSKRPELLRQVDPMNLRMLSVDSSNRATAEANPDLPIAYVYKGPEELAWLQQHAKQIQVILPVKIGDRVMSREEVRAIPANLRKRCCPVDSGTKSLEPIHDPATGAMIQAGWSCQKCDNGGGLGCFMGTATGEVKLTEDRVKAQVRELRDFFNTLEDPHDRERLGAELDILLSEIRSGIDPGSTDVREEQVENSTLGHAAAVGRERAARRAPRTARQDARGAVEHLFENTPKIIHLFESADLSTIVHETGHILLEMMYRSGSEDYLVVARWAGVDEDRAFAGTKAWTDEELERVARAFEAYAMEGKAPTSRLVPTFRQFKSQLLEIYKKIKDTYFGTEPINDDVRRVFDRWVAGESELANDPALEMEDWLHTLDEGYMEMTLEQREQAIRAMHPDETDLIDYERITQRAREMVLPTLAKRRAALEKKLKTQFRKEAEASVADEPFYEMIDEAIAAGGLKHSTVSYFYNSAWIAEVQHKRPGIISRDGGIAADVLANRYGYSTTDEMLQDILYRPGKTEAIETYYDSLWREYEASEHLNDADAYVNVLDVELELFGQMLGKRRPKTRTDLKGIIRRNTGQVKTEDGRALAEQMRRDEKLARAAYKEAQRITRELKNAEIKGLKEEQREALLEQKHQALEKIVKIKEAHRDRMKALKEHHRRIKEGQRIHAKIKKMLAQKSLTPEVKQHFAAIVGQYYKLPMRYTQDAPERTFYQYLSDLEAQGYQNAVETVRALFEALPAPPGRNAAGGLLPLSHENLEALGDFAAALRVLERTVRLDIIGAKKQKLRDLVANLVRSVAEIWKPVADDRHPLAIQREKLSPLFKMSDWAQRYWASLRRIEFMARALDGFKSFGVVWENIFQPMKKAEDAELLLGEQKFRELREAFKGFTRAWANQRYAIAALNGETMTKENMVMAMLNAGNDGNRAALIHGNQISEAALLEIADKLTDKERALVARVWEIIDGLYPLLNKVHKELTGVKLRKVEGKYFPLVFDADLSWRIGTFEAERDLKNMFASEYLRASVEAGHRKARTGGKYAVNLTFDVIGRHVSKAIHDITHQAAVRDVQRIITAGDFRSVVTQVLGDKAYRQFPLWLQEIAKPVRNPKDGLEIIFGKLRQNMTVVAMGFKVLTALQNLTGYSQVLADSDIGVMRALGGIKQFYKNPWDQKRFVDEASVFMRQREKTWDREMAQFYKDFNPREFKTWGKCKEAFFAMMQLTDRAVAYPAWMAGYQAELDRSGDHARAIEAGDQAVRRNVPVSSAKDMADIQRGSEFKKALVMFYSFFGLFHNRLVEVWGQKQLGKLNIIQMVQAHFLLLVLPSVLSTLLYSRGEWDNKDVIAGLIRYALGGLPYFRDVANGLVTDYDYQISPIAGAGMEIQRTGKDIEAGRWHRIPKRAVNLSGYAAGIPSQQITTTMEGAYDLMTGETRNPLRLILREQKDARR
jgi:hypothetical protein